jgi:hypothetical protein
MAVKQHHDPYKIEFTNNGTRPSLKILRTVICYPSAENLPKKRRVIITVLDEALHKNIDESN